MEKNCQIYIRKCGNGFIVTPATPMDRSVNYSTYSPAWELVFETLEKLNAFLSEHYKD